MGYSAMMAAVLCVLSPIAIPMGTVPITLSVFALFLVASLSPVKVAITACAVYLAVGAVGLPVFSSFTGGVYAFVSPSGGFLWGYLPAVLIVSLFFVKPYGKLISMLGGLLVLYAFGLLGFCLLTDATVWEGVVSVVLLFLLPDLLKISAVLLFYSILAPRLSKTLLQNG